MIYSRSLPTSTKHAAIPSPVTSHTRAKLLKYSIFLSTLSDGLIVPKTYVWNLRYRIEMRLNSAGVRSQMISFFLGRNICYLCYHCWWWHPLICPLLPRVQCPPELRSNNPYTSDALLTKTRNVTYYLLPTSILITAAFSHCTNKISRYQARKTGCNDKWITNSEA